MADFNEILNTLKEQIVDLAKGTLRKYRDEAIADGKLLLETMKEDLKRWTVMLAEDKLTTEDFEWLVNAQKDTIKMEGLKQAGLALVRIDQFKNSLLNLFVDVIFDIVL